MFHFGAKKFVQFESFWTKIEGFDDAVKSAWHCDASISDPLRRLDFLLEATDRTLQSWSQRQVGNVRQQIGLAKEPIRQFDVAEENKLLSSWERWFQMELKNKMLGVCSLECTIARQQLRLKWLRVL